MNPFDILEKLENPVDGSRFVLYLLNGRSAFRVFQAFERAAPGEAELQALLSSQAFVELVDEVATVFGNVRAEVAGLAKNQRVTTEQQIAVIESHYPQAVEAAADFAEMLGVSPEDLISVLLNA